MKRSESDVKEGIQQLLDKLAPGRFICGERKSLWGKSAIGKPVDLQVAFAFDFSKGIIAIEVANVNTTQFVGETCRLYHDSYPLKLLILCDRNIPSEGKKQCEIAANSVVGAWSLTRLGASCFSPVAKLNGS